MDFTDKYDGSGSDAEPFTAAGGLLPLGSSVRIKAPRYHSNDDAPNPTPKLAPGAVLEACNGSDIHLARGATVTTTSSSIVVAPPKKGSKGSKTKHRYLIVWPGMLSLNKNRSAITNGNNDNSTDKKEGDLKDEDEENNDQDNDDDEEDDEKKSDDNHASSAAAKPTKNATATTATLGTLHGLDTDTPTLRIPMTATTEDGKVAQEELTFVGKKIDSSSKFMMLSCSKKGTVACKNIFSSVIVFGDATLHSKAKPKEDNDDHDDNNNSQQKPSALYHYGGSDRTVDGGKTATELKQGVAVSAHKSRRQTRRKENTSDCDDEGDDEKKGLTPATKPTFARLTLSSDSDEDGEFRVSKKKDNDKEVLPQRSLPRRSASKKESRYDIPDSGDEEIQERSRSSEEEEDDDNDDDTDDDKEKKKKLPERKKSDTKEPAKLNATQPPAKRKKTTPAKKPLLTLDSDDDGNQTPEVKPRKPTSREKAPKIADSNGGDIEDDENGENNGDLGKSPRVSSRSRRLSAKKVQYAEVDEEEESNDSDSEADKASKKNKPSPKTATTKTGKMKTPPKRGASKKKEPEKGDLDSIISDEDSSLDEDTDDQEKLLKAILAKPSPRRQRSAKTNDRKSTTSVEAKRPEKTAELKKSNGSAAEDTDKRLGSSRAKTEHSARPSTGNKRDLAKMQDDDEDSDSDSPASSGDEWEEKTKKTQKSAARRTVGRNAAPKETITLDSSSDDDKEEEGKQKNKKPMPRQRGGKGATSSQKRFSSKNPASAAPKNVTSKKQNKESGGDESDQKNEEAESKASTIKKNAGRSAPKNSPAKANQTKRKSEDIVDLSQTKTPSPAPIKRRRKLSSAKKAPRPGTIQDFTNDDEFNFVF